MPVQTHSEAKHDELRQCALEWYANGVIPRCTEVQIAQTELLRLMGIQGRSDCACLQPCMLRL